MAGVDYVVILGIEGNEANKKVRILIYKDGSKTKNWDFKRTIVSELDLIKAVAAKKLILANAGIERTTSGLGIKWNKGAKSRFTESNKHGVNPMVILSELRIEKNNRLVGYKVATYDGNIRNVKVSDLIGYCSRVSKESAVRKISIYPIQNAIFVEATGLVGAHIKGYTQDQFLIEYLSVNKPQNASPAKVDRAENKKQISKLNELFTEAQIKELKLGKKNGVDIRVYGNNKLSAQQMKEIRLALENKVNPRPYADPSFTPDAMHAYRIQSKYGVDISIFINPEYNKEQIFELSTAYLSGVDVAKLADPKKSANAMAKERIEMETKLWNEVSAREGRL